MQPLGIRSRSYRLNVRLRDMAVANKASKNAPIYNAANEIRRLTLYTEQWRIQGRGRNEGPNQEECLHPSL